MTRELFFFKKTFTSYTKVNVVPIHFPLIFGGFGVVCCEYMKVMFFQETYTKNIHLFMNLVYMFTDNYHFGKQSW